jgi:hypothetical protein
MDIQFSGYLIVIPAETGIALLCDRDYFAEDPFPPSTHVG